MTTIWIAYEVDEPAVARVHALLDDVALRDPDWNGADFVVERGESTCIDARDEVAGTALLARVQAAIDPALED